MPALPAVNKVIRVTMKSVYGEDVDLINRFFLSYSGATTNGDLATYAATIATEWGTEFMGADASNQLELVQVDIEDLTSATAPVASVTEAIAGTASSACLSAGAAMCVRFHIARRYRGGHPKMYLAGLPLSLTTDPQRFTSVAQTGFAASAATFFTYIEGHAPAGLATVAHVNVSYFSGFTNHTLPSGRTRSIPTPRGTPLVDPVLSYSVNPHICSQRRRNRQGL